MNPGLDLDVEVDLDLDVDRDANLDADLDLDLDDGIDVDRLLAGCFLRTFRDAEAMVSVFAIRSKKDSFVSRFAEEFFANLQPCFNFDFESGVDSTCLETTSLYGISIFIKLSSNLTFFSKGICRWLLLLVVAVTRRILNIVLRLPLLLVSELLILRVAEQLSRSINDIRPLVLVFLLVDADSKFKLEYIRSK